MKWTDEADEAIKKVPFFVRKKVKARVENEAIEAGKTEVSLSDVKKTQARFLSKMSSEIKGYQVETCFASGGCRHKVVRAGKLLDEVESIFKKENILSFLKERVAGELKFHNEFRVTIAECPNACSQPQIKDIGIIGAAIPEITDEACTGCNDCIDACKEKGIHLNTETSKPDINFFACLYCGQCIKACPTGTIREKASGYRIQLGGRLGRHPRLARELEGIFTEQEVVDIVQLCVKFYKEHSTYGDRFSVIMGDEEFEYIQGQAKALQQSFDPVAKLL